MIPLWSTCSLIAKPPATAEDPLYSAEQLHGIVGTDSRQPFDMRDVISRLVDGSRFREFKKEYGPTIVTVRLTYLNIYPCTADEE